MAKDLKRVTRKTEKVIRQFERLERVLAAQKPKVKAVKKAGAKKPTKLSATDTVLAVVKRSRKGVDTAALEKKTGFESKKVRDITYRLKKQRTRGIARVFMERLDATRWVPEATFRQ